MKRRDVLNSPRLREIGRKRTKVLRNKFFISLVVFLFLFSMFALASRAESINIKKIDIAGNKTISAGLVEEQVRDEISGNYLWFFPKTNFFLFPKSNIVKRLEEDFKLLKNIEITLEEGGVLKITFEERVPAFTWCGENLPARGAFEDRKCYFLDDDGYIFDEAPYFSGSVYFRFFGKVGEDEVEPVGQTYFPEVWDKLKILRKTLSEMELELSSIYIKEDGDMEIYLASSKLPPDSQKIILKTDSDFDAAAENLDYALQAEPLRTDFKKKFNTLEYLDLRFGNKVFFKFQ